MTEKGEFLVTGGYGNAGGPANSNIVSFAGADGWYDDIGDGPVTAEIEAEDRTMHKLSAWVVSGAPKLAPELINIASLADTFIDVGVRPTTRPLSSGGHQPAAFPLGHQSLALGGSASRLFSFARHRAAISAAAGRSLKMGCSYAYATFARR